MKRLAIAIGAASMAVFLCMPAAAHDLPCGKREKIIAQLQQKYGEVVIFRGIVEGAMAELWYSPRKQTWTVVVSRANGTACLMVGGDNAMLINPAPQSGSDDDGV